MYNKYVLNGNFVEGLQICIHQSMLSIWSSNKHASAEDLLRHVKYLINLKAASFLEERTCDSTRVRNHRDNRKSQEAMAM